MNRKFSLLTNDFSPVKPCKVLHGLNTTTVKKSAFSLFIVLAKEYFCSQTRTFLSWTEALEMHQKDVVAPK